MTFAVTVDRREEMIMQPMIEETHSQGSSVPMASVIALSNEASFLPATGDRSDGGNNKKYRSNPRSPPSGSR
jgi:hypothetical protein